MRVGIDFGTSNSSAAVYEGGRSSLIPLDPGARNPAVMRTLLYLGRDGCRLVGKQALDTYHAQNIGRTTRLARVQIGVIQNTFAEVGTTYTDIFVWVDENEPGRLFQSLKTALRDASYRGTSVYGKGYSLEQLIAELLSELRERIERERGELIDRAVFGRPVRYSDDAVEDAAAEHRMRTACELAGFKDVTLLEEPVGAALSYGATVTGGNRVLVFDFGGGTLDVTVMELEPGNRYRVLATGGTPIGGDALDRRIMQRKLLKQFGVENSMGTKGLVLPARVSDLLLSWQTIPQLNAPSNRSMLDMLQAQRVGPAARRFRALECLITRNYGLPLFEAIEAAKVRLSFEDRTRLEFVAEAIVLDELMLRAEFDVMIADDVRKISQCVDDTLLASGLTADQIDAVIRTGGSSAIPIFVRMLANRFGADKVREHSVFTGVTEGLAIAAANLPHAVE